MRTWAGSTLLSGRADVEEATRLRFLFLIRLRDDGKMPRYDVDQVLRCALEQVRVNGPQAIVLGFSILRVDLRESSKRVGVGGLKQQPPIGLKRMALRDGTIPGPSSSSVHTSHGSRASTVNSASEPDRKLVQVRNPMVFLSELNDLDIAALHRPIGKEQTLLYEERLLVGSAFGNELLLLVDRRIREVGGYRIELVLRQRDARPDLLE